MGEERFGEFVAVRRHGDGDVGHVAELALDRPKAMNAVSTEMARSIKFHRGWIGGREK